MRLLLLLLAASLTGVAVFHLSRGRELPLLAERQRRRAASKARGASPDSLLTLAGIPAPPWSLPAACVLSAAAAFLAASAATGNVPLALLTAVLGWCLPQDFLASLAASRWHAADHQAYTLANSLRFVLPLKGHPVEALKEARLGVGRPLQDWLDEALAREAGGERVEDVLQEVSVRMRHQELALLAEIVRSDRHAAPSATLLDELMEAWTERIRGDQERRARLSAGQTFTNLVLWGPILGFLLLSAFVPGFSAAFAGPLGTLVAALGMALLVGAYLVSRHVLARERGFLR